MKKLEPHYTVADTAKILNVSEKTVRRLIEDESLRVINLRRGDGRRGLVRIDPADLEDFIRDHRSMRRKLPSLGFRATH
jgi:excisionase family DNA binding protein